MTRALPRLPRLPARICLALAAAAAASAIFASSSLAATCTLNKVRNTNPGNALFDSGGYEFDTANTPATITRDGAFATLRDGGSNSPAGTPPGPVLNSDSWDEFGALFVGGDDLTNLYASTNDDSCVMEAGGQQIAFPLINIGGLDVQRKLFVSKTGLPGGRLLELVHNPGATPVTTSVQVGDTKSTDNNGDLGSDATTAVSFSSNGNNSLESSDLWAVTSDTLSGTLDDDALAHVFDGAGGADHIDFATLTGTEATTPQDNLAYRWDGVSIPPGGTAAFLSYEIQQADATLDALTDTGLARDQALAYEALPLTQIYSGMTDAEIAAVRNWPHPIPTAAIANVAGATDRAPVNLASTGSQASNAAGVCQGASFAWNFGDGSTGTGATVSHQFSAGNHTVTLTVANSCGSSATTTRVIAVADKTAPAVSASIARRIKFSKLAAGKLVLSLKSSENATATIAGKIPASIAKQAAAAKLSRTVVRKTARLKANKRTKVHLKLSRKARSGLASLHRGFTLSLTVTTRDAAGNKRVTHKHVKVTF
jgi:PKD domain